MSSKKTISETKPESGMDPKKIPWRKIIYFTVMGVFLLIIGFLVFATLAS